MINYRRWQEQMTCFLESHDMLGFIDGTLGNPNQIDDSKKKADKTAMKAKYSKCMHLSCCAFHIKLGGLKVGFYSNTCPDAESIVAGFVRDATRFNPQVPAFLLRLHFHDCFVQGCDGSILVDNGEISEKLAVAHQGVKGFDVIEDAKAQLEFVCPGVVSCADIVAMAARDAVGFSFGPVYEVETGRRDGFVSNFALADTMPDFRDSIQLLKQKFFQKRLNEKDLVLLSGFGSHNMLMSMMGASDANSNSTTPTSHALGTTPCMDM